MLRVENTGPAALRAALRAALAEGEPFLLLCEPGTVFAPEMLAALENTAAAAPPQMAALAARVLPNGFAWHCDPVTLETDWLSLDGVILRCDAVRAVGGFDARLTGAAAAADLCLRLRAAGYTLQYCPAIEAWRDAPLPPKDLTAYVQSTVDACRLFARHGALWAGLCGFWGTVKSPRHYPGVRKALLRAAPGTVFGALAAAARHAPAAQLQAQ